MRQRFQILRKSSGVDITHDLSSNEELQSTNEELNTLNEELRSRNDELSRAPTAISPRGRR